MKLSYTARALLPGQPVAAKRLLQLMDEKETNLALSADVTEALALLALADQLGPEIAILKTHIDILADFTWPLIQQLRALAQKHRFLIFEDRKFADIGNTVKHQYRGGLYRIAEWADYINAHTLPGPGIIQGLLESHPPQKPFGLILIAEMSSRGHLMNTAYTEATLKMAEHYPEAVIGFITQHALSPNPRWIYLTPGIKLEGGEDTLGQQYHTPHTAIIEKGADVIIVGRDIIAAQNPLTRAKAYRKAGWEAYKARY